MRIFSWISSLFMVLLMLLAPATASAALVPLTNVKSVSTGGHHSCAVLDDSTIKCWGDGSASGELGNGTETKSATPVSVSGITNARSVSAGEIHSCAVLLDGKVKCWGHGQKGQLGNGGVVDSSVPVEVTGISSAKSVSTGGAHSCALLTDGKVKCWGRGTHGELGNGSSVDSPVPVDVTGITNATSISVGEEPSGTIHTCALLDDGTIKCWGDGNAGQLGNQINTGSNIPVEVLDITDAVSVDAGPEHTCAVLNTGKVMCWGQGTHGELGNGSKTSSQTPVEVQDITNATSVSANNSYACARLDDGKVKCWGLGFYGELGNKVTDGSDLTPAEVLGITAASSVSAGYRHACVLLADHTVKCWGLGGDGQLGNGKLKAAVNTPVEALGLASTTSVSAGSERTCSVDSSKVYCWGWGLFRSFGIELGGSAKPAQVAGITTATQVSAGTSHSCALLSTHTIKCWGLGVGGQLGDGLGQDSETPVEVLNISTAASISAGESHNCVVLQNNTIQCWGAGASGQLGNESYAASNIPVPVSNISNASSVSAGFASSCALLQDGAVKCWGWNYYGQLGNGAHGGNSNVPVAVQNITSAISVSAGAQHSCAVVTGGKVYCWGDGSFGQLGQGTTDSSDVPVEVQGVTNAKSVSAGTGHTCAALTDGKVKCWGLSHPGTLGIIIILGPGDPLPPMDLVPVEVSGITNALSVTAGGSSSCALLDDGKVKCWGSPSLGELGDGSWDEGGHYPISQVPSAVMVEAASTPPVENDPIPPTNETPTNETPQVETPTDEIMPDVTKPRPFVTVPAAGQVKLSPRQTIRSISRSGRVRLTFPRAQRGSTVNVQLVVTAKVARSLKLRVGPKQKSVVIGSAKLRVKKNGNAVVVVRLTRQAKRALQRSRARSLTSTARLSFTQPGKRAKAISVRVRLRR